MGVLIAVALFVVEATLHGCTRCAERADAGTLPSTGSWSRSAEGAAPEPAADIRPDPYWARHAFCYP
jgi:hypothetical protein